jgi:ketosteroid isomerase-like protein
MRRSAGLSALLFIVLLAACQAPAPDAGPLSDEEAAAIESTSDEWAESLMANDATAANAFYAADAVLMPPNMPSFGIGPALEEFLAGFTVTDFSTTSREIDGRGDLAYERAHYEISSYSAGAAEIPTTSRGKYLNIWRKQADGSWLITINTWNDDAPPPEPESEAVEPQAE